MLSAALSAVGGAARIMKRGRINLDRWALPDWERVFADQEIVRLSDQARALLERTAAIQLGGTWRENLSPEVLERTRTVISRAVAKAKPEDPARWAMSRDLGMITWTLGAPAADEFLLREAASLLRDARAAAPIDDRAAVALDLADVLAELTIRHEAADEEPIEIYRGALGKKTTAMSSGGFASLLLRRATRSKDRTAILAAAAELKDLIAKPGLGRVERAELSFNISSVLMAGFPPLDLDEAIQLQEFVIKTLPIGHREIGMALALAALARLRRFEGQRDKPDLDRARDHLQRIMQMPVQWRTPERASKGIAAFEMAYRNGVEIQYLKQALAICDVAVAEANDETQRAEFLMKRALLRRQYWEATEDAGLIDSALEDCQRGLLAVEGADPTQDRILEIEAGLEQLRGVLLEVKFEHFGVASDREAARLAFRRATELLSSPALINSEVLHAVATPIGDSSDAVTVDALAAIDHSCSARMTN